MTELAPVDHTNLDMDGLLDQLYGRIDSDERINSKWTDRGESDVGRALLELFAFVNTSLLQRLDMTANELFLATARQRGSVIRLANLIGYRVAGNISSSATLKFTVDLEDGETLRIPKFSQVSTTGSSAVGFHVWRDLELSNNSGGNSSISGTTIALQGELATEVFTSDGMTLNEEFPLPSSDIGQNTIDLRVDDTEWVEVDDFLQSNFESPHYTFGFDAQERGFIRFGDGAFGRRPRGTIVVRYLRSLGSAGNVGGNTIVNVANSIVLREDGDDDIISFEAEAQDDTLRTVTLTVTNESESSGGRDRESIESVKLNAPANRASSNRVVTENDYVVLLRGVDGVAKANAWGETNVLNDSGDPIDRSELSTYVNRTDSSGDRRTTEDMLDELVNLVYVIVAPPSSSSQSFISENLEENLNELLNSTSMIAVTNRIWHPHYARIDVRVNVKAIAGFNHETVETTILDALSNFFSIDNREFGQSVRFSQLSNLVSSLAGVDYFDLKIRKAAQIVSSRDLAEEFEIFSSGDSQNNQLKLLVDSTKSSAEVTIDLDADKVNNHREFIKSLFDKFADHDPPVKAIPQLIHNGRLAITSNSDSDPENSIVTLGDGSANSILELNDFVVNSQLIEDIDDTSEQTATLQTPVVPGTVRIVLSNDTDSNVLTLEDDGSDHLTQVTEGGGTNSLGSGNNDISYNTGVIRFTLSSAPDPAADAYIEYETRPSITESFDTIDIELERYEIATRGNFKVSFT